MHLLSHSVPLRLMLAEFETLVWGQVINTVWTRDRIEETHSQGSHSAMEDRHGVSNVN